MLTVKLQGQFVNIRCGLADVLDALQWVNAVGAAKDAGSKHDGEGVG